MRAIVFLITILCSLYGVSAYAVSSEQRQRLANEKFIELIQRDPTNQKIEKAIISKFNKYFKTGQGSHWLRPKFLDSRTKPDINAKTRWGQTALEIVLGKINSLEKNKTSTNDILKTHYLRILDLLLSKGATVKVQDLLPVMPVTKDDSPNELTQKLLKQFDKQLGQTHLTTDDLKMALKNEDLATRILSKSANVSEYERLLQNQNLIEWAFKNKIPVANVKKLLQAQTPTSRREIDEIQKAYFSHALVQAAQSDPFQITNLANYAKGLQYNPQELARASLSQIMEDKKTIGIFAEDLIRNLADLKTDDDFMSWACHTNNATIKQQAQETLIFNSQLLGDIGKCPALIHEGHDFLKKLKKQVDEIHESIEEDKKSSKFIEEKRSSANGTSILSSSSDICNRGVKGTEIDSLLSGIIQTLQDSLIKYLKERKISFDRAVVNNEIETFLRNRTSPKRAHILSLGIGLGHCTWSYADGGEIFLDVNRDQKRLLGEGSYNQVLRVLQLRGGEFRPVALRINKTYRDQVKILSELEKDLLKNLKEKEREKKEKEKNLIIDEMKNILKEEEAEEAILTAIGPDQKGINVPSFVQFTDSHGHIEKGSAAPIFEKGTLFDVFKEIDENKKLTSAEKLERKLVYFTEVADGESNLQKMGIVHLDLKPANVLVSDHAYIHDFGVSINLNKIDLDNKELILKGTKGYSAPESFGKYLGAGDKVQKKERLKQRDVFTLGVMLADELIKMFKNRLNGDSVSVRINEYSTQCLWKPDYFKCFGKKLLELINEIENLVMTNHSALSPLHHLLFRLAGQMMNLDPDRRPTMEEVATELSGFTKSHSTLIFVQPRFAK